MIDVRDKTKIDAAALQSLVEGATRELRKLYRPKHAPVPRPPGGDTMIVAVEDRRLVGAVEYLIGDDEVLVQGLAVHPDHRRRGLARALITRIEGIARERGKVRLTLRTIWETGNARVFQRLGFETIGEYRSHRFESPTGGAVVEVVMERPLPPAW